MMRRIFHPRGDQHYARRTPERVRRGSAANGAKLNDDERAAIRQMADVPGANQTRIGRVFGVSRQTVWRERKKV
jgi:predicted DNA-binding protein (UPF0251 family)